MFVSMPPTEYGLVLPLFECADEHLAPLAVICGEASGKMYVDDLKDPCSALLVTGHRYYLAGAADNEVFNRGLRSLLVEKIIPVLHSRGSWGFLIYPVAEEWAEQVEGALLAGVKTYKGERQYWELDLDQEDWEPPERPVLPDGYWIQAVNESVLEDPRLTNRNELAEEMMSERPSVEAFLEKSFGLVVRSDTLIASWCLSEYNLDNRCEVGIATAESLRLQGLATLTATAFIEQARHEGISRIGWHSWTRNEGSVATARKLRFSLVKDLVSYFVSVE